MLRAAGASKLNRSHLRLCAVFLSPHCSCCVSLAASESLGLTAASAAVLTAGRSPLCSADRDRTSLLHSLAALSAIGARCPLQDLGTPRAARTQSPRSPDSDSDSDESQQ